MRFDVFIYQKSIKRDMEEVFEKLNNHVNIEYLDDEIMMIKIDLDVDETLIDLDMVHASIVTDFGVDTTMIYLKENVYNFISKAFITKWIKTLPCKVFDIVDILIVLAKNNFERLILKRHLVNYLGQETINTILMIAKKNMNLSVAAKKLYLHRNSLNYRIDKIYQLTDIDVKTFRGLRALVSVLE
ncbi:MAG: helix-turn-helix domain-containing protein [Candidatus Izimaplasma sp.]|nr:helix-turn-helix domain-containing protein [Candidatus Izimaplasma bacterium]